MSIRKPRNPELNKAVDSLGEAAQHVRNALRGKFDEVRQTAAVELSKAKDLTLKTSGVAQVKVESALKKAEVRLHKVIAKAQKSLDKALRQAEKRSTAGKAPAPAKKAAAKKAAAKKAPAKKAIRKAAPAKKASAA
jgi:hypothetical protein